MILSVNREVEGVKKIPKSGSFKIMCVCGVPGKRRAYIQKIKCISFQF